MDLEFKLREDKEKKQRTWLESTYKRAISEGAALSGPLLFAEECICIKKNLLKELIRRGYLAFRVKKEADNFKCFMFEIATPLKLKEEGKNTVIEKLGSLDLKRKLFVMNTEIKEVHHQPRYVQKNIAYLIYPGMIVGKDIKQDSINPGFYSSSVIVHTHPYCVGEGRVCPWKPLRKLEETLALSSGDFMMLSKNIFLSALSINGTKFMKKVKMLDMKAFDNRGFLKFEHIKSIAEELSNELIADYSLEALYGEVGMPLVAARRREKNVIEIFTKLKIK